MICYTCIDKMDTQQYSTPGGSQSDSGSKSQADSGYDNCNNAVPNAEKSGRCSAYKIYKTYAQNRQMKMQLYCVTCGSNYDADDLDIIPSKVIRAGWQCPVCKVCQGCRTSTNENEMIMCDLWELFFISPFYWLLKKFIQSYFRLKRAQKNFHRQIRFFEIFFKIFPSFFQKLS